MGTRAWACFLLATLWLRVTESLSLQRVDPESVDPESWATSTTRPIWKKQPNTEAPRPDLWKPTQEELSRIHDAKLLCNNTEGGTQNGAVIFLITRWVDWQWFYQYAITRLHYYFLKKWPYPVLVFVPSAKLRRYDPESFDESPDVDYVNAMLQANETMQTMNISVIEYDLRFPEAVSLLGDWKTHQNECARNVPTAYKHMNQFFTERMYQHPALWPYDYYMRLDVDFLLQNEVPVDPFCMLQKTGRKFMYQSRHVVRDPECSEGMWEWFESYSHNHSIVPRDKKLWGPQITAGTYVGYIGVGDLNWFRSSRVAKVARAFNEDGRVYLSRWSDQTYYVILLALLEDHNAVGDVGVGWPETVWCHKCKPKRKSTMNALMGLDDPTDEPFTEPDMPTTPGCYFWMPSGCRGRFEVWRAYQKSIRKAPTEARCYEVAAWYNTDCDRTDARIVYVTPDGIAKAPEPAAATPMPPARERKRASMVERPRSSMKRASMRRHGKPALNAAVAPKVDLWGHYLAPGLKCVNWMETPELYQFATRIECQQQAISNGHRYYQYGGPTGDRCATMPFCRDPMSDPSWRIFEQGGQQHRPTLQSDTPPLSEPLGSATE